MTFVHKTFTRVQGPPSIARRVQTAIWWRLYSCVLLCYWVNTNFSLSQMLYKAKDHHTRCCLILFSKRLLIFFNSLNFFYFSVYNWNRQYVTRLDLLVTMAKWKRRVFIFKKKKWRTLAHQVSIQSPLSTSGCVLPRFSVVYFWSGTQPWPLVGSLIERELLHTPPPHLFQWLPRRWALSGRSYVYYVYRRMLCKDGSVRGCSEPMNDTH
jgi:hypothetical protein